MDESSASSASDVREVHNYVVATEYGLEQIKHRPITLSLLRELHERLLHQVHGERDRPGEFRDVQNWVGASNDIAAARYVPPPVMQMQDALGSLEKYFNSKAGDALPPVVRLAMIHYQFEAIHPFRDGSGRIGRLLVILLLVHWNILPSHLLYLSAYLERSRKQYYDSLLSVSTNGEWEAWIIFFAQGIFEQARDASKRAKHLEDLRRTWRSRLVDLHASPPAHQLCDWLFERPLLTIPQAAAHLKVAYNTARTAIEYLVSAKVLEPLGGKSVKYICLLGRSAFIRRKSELKGFDFNIIRKLKSLAGLFQSNEIAFKTLYYVGLRQLNAIPVVG